jgi:hypothetical protein
LHLQQKRQQEKLPRCPHAKADASARTFFDDLTAEQSSDFAQRLLVASTAVTSRLCTSE